MNGTTNASQIQVGDRVAFVEFDDNGNALPANPAVVGARVLAVAGAYVRVQSSHAGGMKIARRNLYVVSMRQEIERGGEQRALDVADSVVVDHFLGEDFTRGQYRRAFDRVCNGRNWKLEVDAVVRVGETGRPADVELAIIGRAVSFFTGSVLTWTPEAVGLFGAGTYRVKAEGYYAAVGA